MYTCISSLLDPLPSHPSRSSQSTELSSLGYTVTSYLLPILHMEVYMSTLISQFNPPSPFPHFHMSILYICISIPSLQIGSSLPFFYTPHICTNMQYILFFLTYFTTYDRIQVHPHRYKWPNFIPFCGWVIVYVYHILFIHSSVNGHLVASTSWLL